MNISTLCDKIELQPQVKERVLSFIRDFDFEVVDLQLNEYLVYEKWITHYRKRRMYLVKIQMV